MPYIYVPINWTNSTTSWVFDPSHNNDIGSLFPIAGPTCYMTSGSGVASADIHPRVQPLFDSTKDLFIRQPSWYLNGLPHGTPNEYFGGAYQDGINDPPGAEFHDFGRYRTRAAGKMKDFIAAKERGEIVLRNIDTFATSAVCRPGVVLPTSPSPLTLRLPRSQVGAFPLVASAACSNRKGTSFNAFPGMITGAMDGRDGPAMHVWSVVQRYNVGPDPWYMPSKELAKALSEKVYSAFDSSYDSTALVTATLAEANNKHWDILTEVAELPETIRYIVTTLRDILRLVSNFKKEIARIRKRFNSAHGRAVGTVRLADLLAQKWLEFRYAVMPMVYSVQTALEYLKVEGVEYQTTRKRLVRELIIDDPEWDIEPVMVYDRCFVKRRFELDLDGTSKSRFLTTNALLTAWELRKLSFVVDWVINIGDFVTSLVPPSGIIQQGSMLSHQIPPNLSVKCTSKVYPGASVTLSLGRYKAQEINPLCHIGITTSVHLNWQRALDAISLFWLIVVRSHR